MVYKPKPETKVAIAAANHVREGAPEGVKSREAKSIVHTLLDAEMKQRRSFLKTLEAKELPYVLAEVYKETGTIYGLYFDDPVGFGEDILGETYYGTQRDVMAAIPFQKRLMVPAGFGLGKTHLAGRVCAWWVSVHPVGDALCVTTATRFRQVRNQLWPHIRRVQAAAKLPGACLQTEWWMPDIHGVDTQVAYGFTAPANDEAAMQGIHANKLLLIVDEAGGIDKAVGEGTNNLLTGDARMLAIGNPPTDDPGGWFESMCDEGVIEAKVGGTLTIPMPVPDNPNITGEWSPVCKAHINIDNHTVASHLPDQEWVDRTIASYGEDHPYVIAKVFAGFPKSGSNKAIPVSWVEAALEQEDPEGSQYVSLAELALDGETADYVVEKKSWVRLGVDVAADGGDEFVISRAIGDLLHERHRSSGSVNANAVDVAEKVLEEILAAQRLAKALRSPRRVRVKIDTIGVGWGVVSMLHRWGPNGTRKHQAEIIGVNVAESVEKERQRELDTSVMRPANKRAELWLVGRSLMQPDPKTGEGRIRLRMDRQAAAQFSTPNTGENSGGMTTIEGKKQMKKRGLKSPDRAEAALLAIYEPFPVSKRRGRGLLNG